LQPAIKILFRTSDGISSLIRLDLKVGQTGSGGNDFKSGNSGFSRCGRRDR
jgi:hypothetical protein